MQKPLWIELNKNDFDLLTQYIYNNLNNDKFKTTVDKKAYDLEKCKNVFSRNNYPKNQLKGGTQTVL